MHFRLRPLGSLGRLHRLAGSLRHARRGYGSGRPGGARNLLYGGVMVGAASVLTGLAYLLAKDMLFKGGAYQVIDDAVRKIEANSHLVQLLGGLPLSVYGHATARSRRRPAVHESLLEDGARCMEASFFVEGQHAVGRVHLQMVEGEDGLWRERYFAVEVPGHPVQVLVQPAAQPAARPSGWSPFNRFTR